MGWLAGWRYRKLLCFEWSSIPGAYMEEGVITVDLSAIETWKFNVDMGDIVFTELDGVTVVKSCSFDPLPKYWPDNWTKALLYFEKTLLSVRQPIFCLYMYYGNPNMVKDFDDFTEFIFHDDFNDESIDSDKWTITAAANGGVTEDAYGNLVITHTVLQDYYIIGKSPNVYGPGHEVLVKFQFGAALPAANERISMIGLSDSTTPRSNGHAVMLQLRESTWNTYVRVDDDYDVQEIETNAPSIASWHTLRIKYYGDACVFLSLIHI